MNNCFTTIIMRPSFCLRQALEEFTIWRTQLLWAIVMIYDL